VPLKLEIADIVVGFGFRLFAVVGEVHF